MSAHTASWHRPTGRHAAQDWVLVRRWARHAVPDLSVSLAHRRRAAWNRWAPRAGAER